MTTGPSSPGSGRRAPEGTDADGSRPAPAAPTRRRRRAVRPGAGDPDPSVGLRADDDLDVGWQAASTAPDADDERLRREVPPHW